MSSLDPFRRSLVAMSAQEARGQTACSFTDVAVILPEVSKGDVNGPSPGTARPAYSHTLVVG